MIIFKSITLLLALSLFSNAGKLHTGHIQEGDVYFVQMNYKEAIARYEKEPGSAEAQWKIARANICIVDISQKEEKRAYIINAEKASRKSIAINYNLGEGHTWLAATLGNKAIFEGSKSKVLLCYEIKKELDIALKLNPNDDVAYSILGTYYRVLGNISWLEKQLADIFIGKIPPGGYPDSEAALKKAIALSPRTIRHWYEIGKLYDTWGKEDLARSFFKKGAQLPPQVESDRKRLKEMNDYLND